MGRKIILLSDGTGNSSAKVWRTNVWRTFEALDLSGNDQVAYYDDGVGTSSFKPLAVLGGVFGFGLRRNVLTLYKFACRNYRGPEDQLFGFGFSRGAFTIRIVMGLIANQGLIKVNDEIELHSLASAAYRAYRRERYKKIGLKLERPYQFIRNIFGPAYPPSTDKKIDVAKVHFIGVWDTVSAYGMPIKEMNDGIHRYLWPIELPDGILNPKVQRAFQALALDEERTTFHPQLWKEDGENIATADLSHDRSIGNERITQVWFSGVHSNVGGGYPDDSLAYIPFVWMITQARAHGLRFKSDYSDIAPAWPPSGAVIADPDTFKNAVSRRDKDGRLYDPRSGLGGYYRYGPRKLVPEYYEEGKTVDGDEVDVERAKIHESVFRRVSNHAHPYAPIGLPPLYDVVTNDGSILRPDAFKIEAADTHAFEDNAAAAQRWHTQEHVWNEVWKRRVIYFASVAATIWLFIFPLIREAPHGSELDSRFRWLSDILAVTKGFLPSHARFWIDGYAREPGLFFFSVLTLVILLKIGATIASKTSRQMNLIWRKDAAAPHGLPTGLLYAARTSRAYLGTLLLLKTHIAPFFFFLTLVYFGGVIASHLAFNVQDVWGATCRPSDQTKQLDVGAPSSVHRFQTSEFCHATGIELKKGQHYLIQFKKRDEWADGSIAVKPGDTPFKHATLFQKALFYIATPLRRDLFEDWFKIVVRYGHIGGEEQFYDFDPTDPNTSFNLTPTRDGELFIFVNDAVIGLPWLYGIFYCNNSGSADVMLQRTK